MATVLGVLTVDSKGRAVFPQRLREELRLSEGTQLLVERESDGRVSLVPAELVPRDQMWFHSPEMRARMARAEQSLEQGHSTRTQGEAETQAYLDRLKGTR